MGWNKFGWYSDKDIAEYLTKLERLGARIELNIEYWESVKVYLPDANRDPSQRKKVRIPAANVELI